MNNILIISAQTSIKMTNTEFVSWQATKNSEIECALPLVPVLPEIHKMPPFRTHEQHKRHFLHWRIYYI